MLRKKLKLSNETNDLAMPTTSLFANIENSQNTLEKTSKFFTRPLWEELYSIECKMIKLLANINFIYPPVSVVYNPIEYASHLHCEYMRKYLKSLPKVLFVGMNPGPWGMCQTGVVKIFVVFNE